MGLAPLYAGFLDDADYHIVDLKSHCVYLIVSECQQHLNDFVCEVDWVLDDGL